MDNLEEQNGLRARADKHEENRENYNKDCLEYLLSKHTEQTHEVFIVLG